jgi:ribonuclease HI
VRGHAGHPENERADALARQAIAELRMSEQPALTND